jgi:hypothetical protein
MRGKVHQARDRHRRNGNLKILIGFRSSIDEKSFRAETRRGVLSDVKRVYHGVSRVCVVWRSKVDAIEHEGQGIDRLRAGDKLNQK